MDYEKVASALLAEVGLTFDDVLDDGRDWEIGPPGFRTIIGRPAYAGWCKLPIRANKMSRQRVTIGLTGPVDCEEMLFVLAHECGHALQRHSSTPLYEDEYDAEMYAIAAFQRHLGRDPHPDTIKRAKQNVRRHCQTRFAQMGADPTKGWRRDILEWCGFKRKVTFR